jgi:hypothetical protein
MLPVRTHRAKLEPPWGYTRGLHQQVLGVQKGLILRGFLEAVLLWRRGRDSIPGSRSSTCRSERDVVLLGCELRYKRRLDAADAGTGEAREPAALSVAWEANSP